MERRQTRLYDRRGAILVLEKGTATFICAWCKRPFMVMNSEGLRSLSAKHGADKHPNVASHAAIEVAREYVRRK